MSGYIFESHGKQFTPDGPVKVESTEEHNRRVERQELATFATGPDRWHGYISHDPEMARRWSAESFRTSGVRIALLRGYPRIEIKTWLGTVIASGRITSVYRGNFHNAIMLRVRVKGTNGRVYVGTMGYESGDFIRLRAVKG